MSRSRCCGRPDAGARSWSAGLEKERRRTREELARKLASWQRQDRVREWRGHLRARAGCEAALESTAARERPAAAAGDDGGLVSRGTGGRTAGSTHHEMHRLPAEGQASALHAGAFRAGLWRENEADDGVAQRAAGEAGRDQRLRHHAGDDPPGSGCGRGACGGWPANGRRSFERTGRSTSGRAQRAQWKAVLRAADGKK